MTTMVSEVYDALRDPQGVSEEKARKAAEAVVQIDAQFSDLKSAFNGLNTAFSVLRVDFEKLGVAFERVISDGSIMTWIIGLVIALNFAILLRMALH